EDDGAASGCGPEPAVSPPYGQQEGEPGGAEEEAADDVAEPVDAQVDPGQPDQPDDHRAAPGDGRAGRAWQGAAGCGEDAEQAPAGQGLDGVAGRAGVSAHPGDHVRRGWARPGDEGFAGEAEEPAAGRPGA